MSCGLFRNNLVKLVKVYVLFSYNATIFGQ